MKILSKNERKIQKSLNIQMGSLQWPYIDELAKMAGIETLDPVYQNMYREAFYRKHFICLTAHFGMW